MRFGGDETQRAQPRPFGETCVDGPTGAPAVLRYVGFAEPSLQVGGGGAWSDLCGREVLGR
jgi:hypothetical protein